MKKYVQFLFVTLFVISTLAMENSTYPPVMPEATQIVYKKVGDVELKLYVFNPEGHKAENKRAVIVYFFGGGWQHGSPQQFHDRCRYFSQRGMVAICVDYRVKLRNKTGIGECIKDAKSAVRYIRKNAKTLGIDPDKVITSGGSAGGHLAAAVADLPGFNEKGEDTKISTIPNAMILYWAAIMIAPVEGETYDEQTEKFLKNWNKHCVPLSPYHFIKEKMPPCLMFHGTVDKTIPYGCGKAFAEKMKQKGNECELVTYDGMGHGWNKEEKAKLWVDSTKKADEFLVKHKYLTGKGDPAEFYKKFIGK